jgi:5-(carboxyamino)imidazole ribonucleotide synthase
VPTLGILGGGQLGRMLALAAAPLGVECVVVEPGDDPPAAVAAEVLQAEYGDRTALGELARRCDAITVELEGVPADAVAWLEARAAVRPSAEIVATVQDRLSEKASLRDLGLPVAAFVSGAPTRLPAIVKARRGGFDGRGQRLVDDEAAAKAAVDELGGAGDVVSEDIVRFTRELSIVAARSVDGAFAAYPLVENAHRDGILRRSIAPAPELTSALQDGAERIARTWMDAHGYVGVMAIELFDTVDGLVVNEIAPRVHNSGHWTIEGAVTSQFEQHVRAVLGWPLGDPSVVGRSVMENLLGDIPPVAELLADPGAHVHLYGKAARPLRKVGHVTVVTPLH